MNKFCRWKWIKKRREAYADAECREGTLAIFDRVHTFIYCPYCGKKIKIIKNIRTMG